MRIRDSVPRTMKPVYIERGRYVVHNLGLMLSGIATIYPINLLRSTRIDILNIVPRDLALGDCLLAELLDISSVYKRVR